MSPAAPATGLPTFRRYTFLREIARSNDIVWEGYDPQMKRRVAIKELALAQHLTGQARRDRIERFYRESRAAGTMNHANIVTIYDAGEENGRYFIVMEFLEGQTLRDRMSVGGPMGLSEAVAVTSALCDALDYAHTKGVVHRDIKPDNIYLLPGGRVKLTDFGIARIQDEDQLTVAGQVFGTPSYMSPEQVLGRPIDARTDIFSLGIMLYEMVSGRKPFTGESVATITYRIVNEITPPITSGAPALESVIQRATAKDPSQRFQSAVEMKNSLEAAESQHRTGGYRAATYAQTPMSPAAPPMPPPGASYAPQAFPNATAQYGTQTQFGVAPGYAPGMAAQPYPAATPQPAPAPYAPPYNPSARPNNGGSSRLATALVTIVVLAVCFVFLAAGIRKAMLGASVDQARTAEQQRLNAAEDDYQNKLYEKSADEAMKVRAAAINDETRANATKTEAYSYLALGQAARTQGDFATAQKWYDLAQQLLPDDRNVQDHLAKFNQAKQYRAAGSAEVQAPGSAGPMPGYVPGPTPQPAPTVTPIPAPRLDTQGFNGSNSQRAAEAMDLYNEGLRLKQQGDTDGARQKWTEAVTDAPGSPAAIQANDMLTQTAPKY